MSDAVIQSLRGGLVVSCQAYPGEPLRFPEAMAAMALAAQEGGAVGIRAQGLDDIRLIADRCPLPLVGLLKVSGHDVFITPTVADALAVAEAGAGIVALDGTRRPRPDGHTFAENVAALHDAGVLVMADCGSLDDGLAAEADGADIVGTTLAGYTPERPKTDGPDLELVGQLAGRLRVPLFCEGRVHTPAQARAVLDAGAHTVVVGTAITHPTTLTRWFAQALTD